MPIKTFQPKQISVPAQRREGVLNVRNDGADDNDTVEVVWSTGARRRVREWFREDYDEELDLDGARLEELNRGAPLLADHSMRIGAVLGTVVEGSARIENGQGVARVRFSNRDDLQPIIEDIRAGIIRNVSVGYSVARYRIEERDGEPDLWTALDWTPREVSAVAVGADPQAQFQRAGSDPLFPCVIERTPAAAPASSQETNGMEPETTTTQTRSDTPPAATGAAPAAPAPTTPAPQAREAAHATPPCRRRRRSRR